MPFPKANAGGTEPSMEASGDAAATTKKTMFQSPTASRLSAPGAAECVMVLAIS
jgi:hypothetical protein